MLSLFPSFFDYSAIVVTVLRIIVAIIFITEGYTLLPKKGTLTSFYKKLIPCIEFLGGIFLLAGLFTQATALILSIVAIKKAYRERKKEPGEERHTSFYFLLFAISLSFLFFGPGLWSIDYPL